jgi:hypothetical protein
MNKVEQIRAEIERLLAFYSKEIEDNKEGPWAMDIAKRDILQEILSFLDTLEVKEVDLEKEIQQHINDCLDIKFPTTDIKTIAKDVEYTARKFFELGLKA